MTATTTAKVEKKLAYLHGALAELRRARALPRAEYDAEKMIQAAVERNFQTAIEAVLDSARLIIIEEQWERPDEGYDEFETLAKHNLFTPAYAAKLSVAKRFRNLLVHHYADVNPDQVYEHLQRDLGDLEEFTRVIAAYLQRKAS